MPRAILDRLFAEAPPSPGPPAWIARVAAAACLTSGVATLAGWATGAAVHVSPLVGSFRMNPVTALAFALCGLALLLPNRVPPFLRVIPAAATAAIGLVNLLASSGTGVPRLDGLLFPHALAAAGGLATASMAPSTATNFVLAGAALVALRIRPGRNRSLADAFALTSLAAVLVPLVGYAYGLTSVAGINWFVPMSLSTAATFLVLDLGILAEEPCGRLLRLLMRRDTGGMVARRLVPAAAALPLALGLLRILGQRAHWFDAALGMILFTVATVVVLAAGGWYTAEHISRAEARHDRAEQERALLAVLVMSSDDAIFSVTPGNAILTWNAGAERLYGYAANDVIGRLAYLLVPPGRKPEPDRIRAILERGEAIRNYEQVHLRRDGSTVTVSLTISPMINTAGRLVAATVTARDISRRIAAEDRVTALNATLQQRAAELEHANAELEAFTYSVSHDLRAPLRHIDGFADLLTRHAHASLDEKGRRYLDTISASARSMGQLIDDLLVFSRIGRTAMRRSDVDLSALVAEIRRAPAVADAQRPIEWTVGPLPVVSGDQAMLRVVFTNLLANAVKYTRTREHPRIEVGAERHGDELIVHVKDNGVGFDMAYAHKLFGVFQRLHDDSEFEGTGIGLASVRRIVHRHGGHTWAEGAVDAGATLYVALPVETETTRTATEEEARHDEHVATGVAG